MLHKRRPQHRRQVQRSSAGVWEPTHDDASHSEHQLISIAGATESDRSGKLRGWPVMPVVDTGEFAQSLILGIPVKPSRHNDQKFNRHEPCRELVHEDL